MRPTAPVLLSVTLTLLSSCSTAGEQPIVIGTKNFTEQILLGELLAQHLEARGLPVERRFDLGSTFICHQALRAGEIDLYVEYTGTALLAILKEVPAFDREEVYQRVQQAYAEQFNLVWTEPLGFNNTFAIVVRGADARRLNLKTLSDVAPHAGGWRAGFSYEFMERADGFAGLARTYGLAFSQPPRTMELGLIYRALEERQVDIAAGSATDGILAARDFVMLEDDRHYFPPYYAVPVVRRETLERYPALRAALAELAGRFSEEEMRRLNYAVDGEQRDFKQVVREVRQAKGL
ncbi:MAG: glycine betaine ABC transporter substrate-binding protein [Terriglobia bacterium]